MSSCVLQSQPKTKEEAPMNTQPVPTYNLQYSLFTHFFGNPDDLSNTIEFWDAIPKFALSPRAQDKMRSPDGILQVYTQKFQHHPSPKGENSARIYQLTMRPARVETGEGWKEYYPSADEELVEEVLRKIHCDQTLGLGIHDPEKTESWVRFSLSMIRAELKTRGKSRSISEIKQSLEILANTKIEVKSTGVKHAKKLHYSPLSDLMSVERADYLDDPKSLWCARLPALYSLSINNLTYRQYNYGLNMRLKSPLSRWLYKRLCHEFLNADLTTPYRIKFTTIERDSGMLNHSRKAKNLASVSKVLAELQQAGALLLVDEKRILQGRKIADVVYSLTAHPGFIKDMIAANKRKSEAEKAYFAAGISGEARTRHIAKETRKGRLAKPLIKARAEEKARQKAKDKADQWADKVDAAARPFD